MSMQKDNNVLAGSSSALNKIIGATHILHNDLMETKGIFGHLLCCTFCSEVFRTMVSSTKCLYFAF
jgi:hypothetical protein